MSGLARLYARLARLGELPRALAARVAPRLEAAARARLRTSRGYTPPIAARPTNGGVVLEGPEWALERATADQGALKAVLEDEARRAFEEG